MLQPGSNGSSIEPAKSNRCAGLFLDHNPGRAADAPALPLMRSKIAPAVAHRGARSRVAHRRRVTEKIEQ